MKCLSFYNYKGGTGKTALNILSSLELERRGNKVLLVDADGQANATSFLYDTTGAEKTIIDALIYNLKLEDIIIKNPLENYPGLDLVPAGMNIAQLESVISGKTAKEKVFLRWFAKNLEVAKNYDYIIFDLSPTPGIINQNIIVALDTIICVAEFDDISSIRGIEDFIAKYSDDIEVLELPSAKMAAVINKYKESESNSKEIFRACLPNFENTYNLLLDTKIHESVAVKTAILYRQSLFDYAKTNRSSGNSRVNKEIVALIDELERKELL